MTIFCESVATRLGCALAEGPWQAMLGNKTTTQNGCEEQCVNCGATNPDGLSVSFRRWDGFIVTTGTVCEKCEEQMIKRATTGDEHTPPVEAIR